MIFLERLHHSGDCLDCLQHEAGRSQRKHNVLRHWMTGPQGHGQHGNMQLSYKIRYLSWNPDWWFGTWFFFPYIGNNNPNWLSFFSEVWNHQPGYLLKSHFDDYVILYYKTVNVKKQWWTSNGPFCWKPILLIKRIVFSLEGLNGVSKKPTQSSKNWVYQNMGI